MSKVAKPKIGSRNPDWNDYIPTVGDRVIVTRIADKSLRHLLGESGKICGINNQGEISTIHLETDKEILGKNIHPVWDDEVLMQKVDD